MTERNFLKKLSKSGNLEIVEGSEKMKEAYLLKSESSIESAKILLEKNKFEESVGLAYYSMYHSLLALLFKCGVKCENHSGAIILLKEIFGIDNSKISFAKKERIDKQYYVDFSVTKTEVIDSIRLAEEFNSQMYDFIEKMNGEDVEMARKKLRGILNE